MFLIREAGEADAAALVALGDQLDREASFMLLEPGERDPDRERLRLRLRQDRESGNLTLVAEVDGRPVGVLGLTRGAYRRNRHSGDIFIGILQAYAGQGIGTRLFVEMERWARAQGLHRLALSVMAHNAAGLALYQKMGFEMEGTFRHSLRVNGTWVDEYALSKLL